MTYEEYLNLFAEIKNTSSNLELLNKLKKGNINPNFIELLIPKYQDLIIDKFTLSISKLKKDLYTIFSDRNYLDLYLVNFKKEIKYLQAMIDINLLPDNIKEELRTKIKEETTNTYNILIKEANREDPNGILALTIKNNEIKWSDNNEL